METKTDNELIAEFMGLPLTKEEPEFTGDRKLKTVPFQRWKYHESWDWLMPVVEKIESLEGVYEVRICIGSVCSIFAKESFENLGSGIEVVYTTVIEFIKWYNQQKS